MLSRLIPQEQDSFLTLSMLFFALPEESHENVKKRRLPQKMTVQTCESRLILKTNRLIQRKESVTAHCGKPAF